MYPQHKIPLETAIKTSVPGHRPIVQALYDAARNVFEGIQTEMPDNFWAQCSWSKATKNLGDGNARETSLTLTDMNTGLFVRFNGITGQGAKRSTIVEGPLLIFGKLYLAETKNPQLQNTAVKLWR